MILPSPSSASTWLAKLLGVLILAATIGATVAWPVHSAYARDDDDDDDDDDGDDGDGDEEEEEEEEDKEQPAVTAGGLYVLQTYPTSEVIRPLTMTEKLTEVRTGLGFDISNETAFESFGILIDARHGYKDNVELQAGFAGIYNFDVIDAYVGAEMALAYDLIDFRVAGRVSHVPGTTKAAIDIGFPFRYVAKPEIAITALDTFFAFNLDGEKPDFIPSVGIITNPHPLVAVILRAQLQVPGFNFSGGATSFIVPATATVQFAATQTIDIGAEFKFLDLTTQEPIKFYDQRFLTFFGQFRFGR